MAAFCLPAGRPFLVDRAELAVSEEARAELAVGAKEAAMTTVR